jgi:hypothetical protein
MNRKNIQKGSHLQREEGGAVLDRPRLPHERVLAQRSVARAGHIGENPVELLLKLGKNLRLMRRHDERFTRESLALMHKHVRAAAVGIVGDDHSRASPSDGVAGVEHLDHLRRLRPRRGTHIEH